MTQVADQWAGLGKDEDVVLHALVKSLEWIDCLIEIHGKQVVDFSMPNDFGGQHEIRSAIEQREKENES